METLDKTDLKILHILQENCRLTTKEIAQKVHLSPTPVYERMRKLETQGYIKKYMAVLDSNKLGCGFIVYCNVKLKTVNATIAEEFTAALNKMNDVTECYNISGDFDYLLKIHAADMKSYQHFILNVLGKLDCIGRIQSVFVMDEIKLNYGIPV